MPPVIVFRKLVISIALCFLLGAAAKAETVSGPQTVDKQASALSQTPSETTGMLLLGTGLVGIAAVLRRKLNADKPV